MQIRVPGWRRSVFHGHGGECSVIRWTVPGMAPATVTYANSFSDADSMDKALNAILQTATYQDAVAKVGGSLVGRAVLTEIPIP